LIPVCVARPTTSVPPALEYAVVFDESTAALLLW
jgi:hypothetical protein